MLFRSGLVTGDPPALALSVLWERLDDAWLADDEALLAGVHTLAESGHVLVEPAGAAALVGAWQHREALAEVIESWMASCGSNDVVTAALTEHRVPHAPVLSLEEAIEHEHFVERGTVRTITDPRLGEVKIAGFPVHSNVPLPPDDHDAPALGEHNADVLGGLLGMSDDQITDLVGRGVIADKPH